MIDPATDRARLNKSERPQPSPLLTTNDRVVDQLDHDRIGDDPLLPVKRWVAAQHPADVLRILLVTVAIFAVAFRCVRYF